jgi:hypothetical protein
MPVPVPNEDTTTLNFLAVGLHYAIFYPFMVGGL